MRGWLAGVAGVMLILSFRTENTVARKEKLSEYGFYKGALANLEPADDVIPYALNTHVTPYRS